MEIQDAVDCALEVAIGLEEGGKIRESLSLYRICAELGDLTAMCKLADVLSDYEAFADLEQARYLYKKACLGGNEVACHNLGVLLDQLGQSAEAQKFYARAKSLD